MLITLGQYLGHSLHNLYQSLNPFNDEPLTNAELTQDCLCYMEYQDRPVKASRLFAGQEHELQTKRLSAHFNTAPDAYKEIKYNGTVAAELKCKLNFDATKKNDDTVSGSAFQTRDLAVFTNYEEAYHCLMLDIMQQQLHATKLVLSKPGVNRIFVDGGFSNNSIYMHLLARAFPQMEVYAASVAQATAMGAALAVHKAWNKKPVPADMVKLKYFKVAELPDHGVL